MEPISLGKNISKVLNDIQSVLENLPQLHDTSYNDLNERLSSILNELQQLCCSSSCIPWKKRYSDTLLSNSSNSSSSINSNSIEAEIIKQAACEEKCMTDAIQHHITKLVDTLVFKESEIPDMIIQLGMATSSECVKLRKLPTPEDQVSGLVSMVIQRDISCMKNFLDVVKEQNACVVNEILETFEYFTQNSNMVALPCVACELKQKCDIKSVYNHFFAENLISYSLHSRIVYDPSPIGAQGIVWDELLHELAEQPTALVLNVFIKALKNNRFHSNLIQMLERLLRKMKSIKCKCQHQSLVDNRPNRTVNKGHTDQANDNFAYTRNIVARQEVGTKAEDSVSTQNMRSNNCESTEDNTDPNEAYTEGEPNNYEIIWPLTIRQPLKPMHSYESSDETTPKTAVIKTDMDNNITLTASSQEQNDVDNLYNSYNINNSKDLNTVHILEGQDDSKTFETTDKILGHNERIGQQKADMFVRKHYDKRKLKQICEQRRKLE